MLNRQAIGRWLLVSGVLIGSMSTALARDVFVDPQRGNDATEGTAEKPVKTIARGIKLAAPGDVIHLATASYHEAIVFHNRHGEPDRPITLDGHGSTVEGAAPLAPADWKEVSPGLYRNDALIRPDLLTRDDAIIGRWFFVFDGKMNHMGRTSKGKSEPLKKPEDLQPGEWTIGKEEHAFYICIDPAKKLDDYRIAAPLLSSGIIVAGDCAHVVVKNVTCQHVQNDGINIHGKTRDTLFQDIVARECGDDGCSAHDDCQIRVDGFASIGNSTGICNTGHSTSENRRVWIQDCLGFDFFVLDEGYKLPSGSPSSSHTLTDSVIVSSAMRSVRIDGSAGLAEPCRLKMENVLVRRVGPPDELRVTKHAELSAERVTLLGLKVQVTGGKVELHHSIVSGNPAPELILWPETTWRADNNVYSLKNIQLDRITYPLAKFAEYQAASGQDAQSTSTTDVESDGQPRGLPAGVGAEPTRLPEIPIAHPLSPHR